MSKKIDERIPREVGKGALPDHPAIKTPWEKLISYHDAAHFCSRYGATVAAKMCIRDRRYGALCADAEGGRPSQQPGDEIGNCRSAGEAKGHKTGL